MSRTSKSKATAPVNKQPTTQGKDIVENTIANPANVAETPPAETTQDQSGETPIAETSIDVPAEVTASESVQVSEPAKSAEVAPSIQPVRAMVSTSAVTERPVDEVNPAIVRTLAEFKLKVSALNPVYPSDATQIAMLQGQLRNTLVAGLGFIDRLAADHFLKEVLLVVADHSKPADVFSVKNRARFVDTIPGLSMEDRHGYNLLLHVLCEISDPKKRASVYANTDWTTLSRALGKKGEEIKDTLVKLINPQ